MQEKKVNWMKVVVSFLIMIFIGVMIWFFVNLTSTKATKWTLRDILNTDNQIALNKEILSIGEEVNGQIITVQGYYTSSDTAKGGLTATNVSKFVYTTTIYDYYNAQYKINDKVEWYVDGDYSINSYFNYNFLKSSSKYSNDAYFIQHNDVLGVKSSQVYKEDVFLSLLPNIIFIIVLCGAGFILIRMLSGSVSGSNKQAMDFNKSRARRIDKSNVHFSDVAGCDEEKVEMAELVDYLKNPGKYKSSGAKLPKGILLVGAPGTGKTLLAKAVAGEANVPFYSISGSDFVEMFVGVGAGRVRDMFRTAKQNAPCLVFIDEIDAVGRQRGAGLGGGNDEREQTLNQLLVEMDGFEENTGILVIAATNRDDVLDPALLRAGRFDRKITVSAPDLKGREAIFKVHARNKQIDSNVNFENLAKRTVGFTGADIATILNDAAILSVRYNVPKITTELIDEAIDRRIAGPAKSSHSMSDDEKRRTAYHEAGHAVLGIRFPDSDKVQRITIIPRGDTGGHVLITPDHDVYNYTKRQLIARIVSYLGGRTSEEIFFDDISTGAYQDIEVATQIARSMVVEYGMSSLGPIQYEKPGGNVFLGRDYTSSQRNFSSDVAKEIDKEIRKIIDDAHEDAKKYLTEYKDDVELIANTLLQRETITAEEIEYLIKNRNLDGFVKPISFGEKIKEEKTNEEPKTEVSNETPEAEKPNESQPDEKK
jgi:cell division protease FtsH